MQNGSFCTHPCCRTYGSATHVLQNIWFCNTRLAEHMVLQHPSCRTYGSATSVLHNIWFCTHPVCRTSGSAHPLTAERSVLHHPSAQNSLFCKPLLTRPDRSGNQLCTQTNDSQAWSNRSNMIGIMFT